MAWTRRGFLGLASGAVAATACGDGRPRSASRTTLDPGGAMETVRYGPEASQRLDLTRPDGATAPPVVVLVHGGFWSAQYDRSIMEPLVPSLVAEGWAVANIDYRGVPGPGAGWPGTFEDAAAAVDSLADLAGLDLDRVVSLGHSAGGHLAVWLAARHRLPEGAPGRSPAVVVRGAVAQAGVLDLVAAVEQRLGSGAVVSLLGATPADAPDRYAAASPAALVPLGVPVELVHGLDDRHVPIDQSRRYAAAAEAAGDTVTLTEVTGDHFVLIDPATDAWAACRAATRRLLESGT